MILNRENPALHKDGLPRLEINPIEAYETKNLSFVHGGIGQAEVEPVHVIRCFNVLFYFDDRKGTLICTGVFFLRCRLAHERKR